MTLVQFLVKNSLTPRQAAAVPEGCGGDYRVTPAQGTAQGARLH